MKIELKTKIVNVGDVCVGNFIKSYHLETEEVTYNRVNEVIHSTIEPQEQAKVILSDGSELIFSLSTNLFVQVFCADIPRVLPWEYLTVSEIIPLIATQSVLMKNDKNHSVQIKDIQHGEAFASTNFIDYNIEDDHNFFVKRQDTADFYLIHNSGACTVAVDNWHIDLEDFLELQTENGDPRNKAHDIFPQIVVSDEFMRRTDTDKLWTLIDPYEVKMKFGKDIAELWGEEFETLYAQIENAVFSVGDSKGVDIRHLEGEKFDEVYRGLLGECNLSDTTKLKLVKRFSAKKLMKSIMKVWVETGMPFIAFKDTINRANPNKHDGMIGSANLCLSGDTILNIKIDDKLEVIRMADLVEIFKDKKEIEVKSFNHESETTEYRKITDAFLTMEKSKVMKITDTTTNKFIICTPKHKVWTENRGYVCAEDLVKTDCLKIE